LRRILTCVCGTLVMVSCSMNRAKPPRASVPAPVAANQPNPSAPTTPSTATGRQPAPAPAISTPAAPPGATGQQPAPAPAVSAPATTPGATGRPPAPAPAISVPAFAARLEPANEAEKKLDGALLKVARASGGGTQQAEAVARSLSILGDDKRIKVDVALNDKAGVPAFREAVVSLGGQVIVALENHVFIYIPPASIAGIASRGDVFSMDAASVTVR